jgi:hypothetical protein
MGRKKAVVEAKGKENRSVMSEQEMEAMVHEAMVSALSQTGSLCFRHTLPTVSKRRSLLPTFPNTIRCKKGR